MGSTTKIEWCDMTFNPFIGCTKVSPGCDNCYAETWAKRFGVVEWGAERRRTSVENWNKPLKWNRIAAEADKRPRVFCASLADVFDNEIPEPWRWDLFWLISQTPKLDWLLLTKRIGNARDMLNEAAAAVRSDFVGAKSWERDLWPNVWIGASICNQLEADRDIAKLLETPACVRFVSIEPMLGPIRLSSDCPDWVIGGGESGDHARACDIEWVRSLRDQCAAAGIPFFWKQWGEWLPCDIENPGDGRIYCTADDGSEREILGQRELFTHPDGTAMARVGKAFAGRLLDGRLHNDYPKPQGRRW